MVRKKKKKKRDKVHVEKHETEQVKHVTVLFLYKPFNNVKKYLARELADFPQVTFIFPNDTSEESLIQLAPKADIIISWDVSESVIQAATNLKLFISPYTGVEHLSRRLREMQNRREFLVANAHGASHLIAQHAVAMLLGITNQIALHHNRLKDGIWVPGGEGIIEDAPSISLSGRSVGFLGYGQINQKVHKLLANFDLKFSIIRRAWLGKKDIFPTPVIKYNSDQLSGFLRDIDILIIAAPHTKKTHNLIRKNELELLGEKGILINIGRADIVKEEDLFEALKNHKIGRAAIDVWYRYKPEADQEGRIYPFNYPFHELDNVLLSPHRADSPFNDLSRWNDVIENIKRMAHNRNDFVNIVNIEEGY